MKKHGLQVNKNTSSLGLLAPQRKTSQEESQSRVQDKGPLSKNLEDSFVFLLDYLNVKVTGAQTGE